MGFQINWSDTFYQGWITRYPEFTTVSEAVAQQYFEEAGLYQANDGSGPVDTESTQRQLLFMVMGHIAMRYAIINGVLPSPLVGRLNSATEGSVTVGTDLSGLPGSAVWWSQTKYGLDYWQATAPYRQFQYQMGPRRFFGPVFPGRFPWGV